MKTLIQTAYKPKNRLTGLFDYQKESETFFDNQHTCSYKIKCETGFGHTIGVAIRRTLLSSMSGYAVVAMRINDTPHLFDSIKGIKESVLDISLNLQKIAFKVLDQSIEYMVLNLKKKADSNGCAVLACDFEKSNNLSIVNGDFQICTLDNNAEIDLQVIIGKDVGYVQFSEHTFIPFLDEGFFAVDSFFSPIINVGYNVEHDTSRDADFDIVTLEITTNGSYSPDTVLSIAGGKIFSLFKSFGSNEIESIKMDPAEDQDEFLNSSIESLDDLSIRAKNCLLSNNIETIAELVERTESELRSLGGFGEKSLTEVKMFLSKYSLQLGKKIIKKRKI